MKLFTQAFWIALGAALGAAALAQPPAPAASSVGGAPAASTPANTAGADEASARALDRPAELSAAGAGGAAAAAQPKPKPAADGPAAGRSGKSVDRLELGTTEISGNRELPKVMYVVPWRRPELGDALGRPPNSLIDEALAPVDREVFQRQNRYFAALESSAATAKSQPGAPATPKARGQNKDER